MLDIKRVRNEFEAVKKAVESRGQGDYNLPRAVELDEQRRALLADVEQLKNRQNASSKEIPKLKKDLKRIRFSYEIREIKTHISSLGPLLSLLIRSVRFSDTMALSIKAKGFSEERSSYKEIALDKRDYLFY